MPVDFNYSFDQCSYVTSDSELTVDTSDSFLLSVLSLSETDESISGGNNRNYIKSPQFSFEQLSFTRRYSSPVNGNNTDRSTGHMQRSYSQVATTRDYNYDCLETHYESETCVEKNMEKIENGCCFSTETVPIEQQNISISLGDVGQRCDQQILENSSNKRRSLSANGPGRKWQNGLLKTNDEGFCSKNSTR